MKLYQNRELLKAFRYARRGGQALHMSKKFYGKKNLPECFKKADEWAHLIDFDEDRLWKTAKQLGVKDIRIHRHKKYGPHVDLCLRPLKRAKKLCEGL